MSAICRSKLCWHLVRVGRPATSTKRCASCPPQGCGRPGRTRAAAAALLGVRGRGSLPACRSADPDRGAAAGPNCSGVLVLEPERPSRVSRHVAISLLRTRATRAWAASWASCPRIVASVVIEDPHGNPHAWTALACECAHPWRRWAHSVGHSQPENLHSD